MNKKYCLSDDVARGLYAQRLMEFLLCFIFFLAFMQFLFYNYNEK